MFKGDVCMCYVQPHDVNSNHGNASRQYTLHVLTRCTQQNNDYNACIQNAHFRTTGSFRRATKSELHPELIKAGVDNLYFDISVHRSCATTYM